MLIHIDSEFYKSLEGTPTSLFSLNYYKKIQEMCNKFNHKSNHKSKDTIMDEKELVAQYINEKQNVEAIEQQLKDAKEALKLVAEQITQYLSDRGQYKTGSYEGLGSIALKTYNKYSVVEENQPALFEFLKENNLDGVIKQSIHHKTFDRICNELVEEGKALPEFVSVYNVSTVQINK